MKRLLHKQTKAMLKIGKPWEELFWTVNDARITFSGVKNRFFNKFDNSKYDSLNQK